MSFSKSWLYSVAGHEKEKERKESNLNYDVVPLTVDVVVLVLCGDNQWCLQ